jgi:deoxyribodipyrimidine photo-lyase
MGERPAILWLRRDLRLADHPALTAACASGRAVIPLFILDDQVETLGAAAKWRLGQGISSLSQAIEEKGSHLILRRGAAADVLTRLIAETGAAAVYWSRLYDPAARARDGVIEADLKARGLEVGTFPGALLFEPWTVQTGTGGFYRVFTPYWKSVRDRRVDPLIPEPARIPAPASWPASDRLDDWALGAALRRGATVLPRYTEAGEAAALARLDVFLAGAIADYQAERDYPARASTSGLSEALAIGEIAPHRIWHAAQHARERGAGDGAETFLKELVWREFAYHLMVHTPHILTRNWREEWDGFPWNEDAQDPRVIAWTRGRTGVPFVDAAMRELYVTGRMHNRARMVVASYLTKHLLTHWRIGMEWFADCLTDWDPASNAMGWQWCAGSGPDAAPYFRIFNPETQRKTYDPQGAYVQAWIAEGQRNPPQSALDYFDAVPLSWRLAPSDLYPAPVVGLAEGRQRALAAYESYRSES